MVFKQITISGDLGRIISEIVYYRDFEPAHPIDRFFPDANAYLILELNDLPQNTYDDQNRVAKTFRRHWFSGNRTQPMRFDSGKGVEMFVITVKNAFAFPILGDSMANLTNTVSQAEELFGEEIQLLWSDLRNLSELDMRIKRITAFFEKQLQWDENRWQWLRFFEALDRRYMEQITVQQLVDEVGLSQKSLIQQFKKLIGITPKEFIRLKRFQKFIGLLSQGATPSNLTTLAFECGYFDQSHCIREFRHYAGTTPKEYLRKRSGYDNYMAEEG